MTIQEFQKTENKKIPELRFQKFSGEWESAEFGDAVQLRKEKYNPISNAENKRCIELESIEKESAILLNTFGSHDVKSIKNIFYKNDVLYGKLRPYLRKFYRPNFDGVCTSEIWVLNGKKLDNNYLYYSVQSNRFNYYTNLSTGSRMPRAEWDLVSLIPINFPSRPEQQKIASFLSSVDKWVTNLRDQKEKLQTYRKGIIQKVFTQEVRFKEEKGKDFPKWENAVFQDVISRFATGLNPRRNFTLGKGNNYYVTIKNIRDGKLYFYSCEKVDDDALKKINNRSDLKAGDIIFSSIGKIGESYLIEERPNNWDINESVFSLRALKGKIIPKFLYYVITNQNTKKYFTNNITGSTFKSIKMRELRLTPFKLPCIKEQQKIADFLTSIDKLIELKEQQINQAKEWEKGLMQNLFI